MKSIGSPDLQIVSTMMGVSFSLSMIAKCVCGTLNYSKNNLASVISIRQILNKSFERAS